MALQHLGSLALERERSIYLSKGDGHDAGPPKCSEIRPFAYLYVESVAGKPDIRPLEFDTRDGLHKLLIHFICLRTVLDRTSLARFRSTSEI